MKHYIATYGIYLNCSIMGTEEYIIEAENEEEAKEKAKELADSIEKVTRAKAPSAYDYDSTDVWASLDDLYEVEEEDEL